MKILENRKSICVIIKFYRKFRIFMKILIFHDLLLLTNWEILHKLNKILVFEFILWPWKSQNTVIKIQIFLPQLKQPSISLLRLSQLPKISQTCFPSILNKNITEKQAKRIKTLLFTIHKTFRQLTEILI